MTAYAGTRTLVRLALRRDRIMLPSWLVAFVLSAAGSAGATAGLYPDEAERVGASTVFNDTQALVALYGRVYDPTSIGALSLIKLGGFGAVFVALLSVLLVVRHTRAEEEAGRQELLGATVVGRRAPLTAALAVAIGTNLVLAVLTGLGLTAAGLPADGSFAFGVAWGGVGITFAAIAAVTAQLTSTARAATGSALAVLGAVYVARAVGDTAGPAGPGWLTWLSPVGWGQQFRPYAGNRWWVLMLIVGFAAIVIAVAYRLVARRDLGAGLLPDRLGPATAGPGLRGPLALAWRLQRGSLVGWAAGFILLSFVLGNIATSVGRFLTSQQAADFITSLGGQQGLTDAYLAATFGFIGIAASAYGVQSALRLRAEEAAGRAEPVLAGGVGRTRWVLSHVLVALVGTTVLMLVAGLGAGGSYALRVHDAAQLGRILGAAAVQLPAVWVLTGIAVAGFGLLPRLAGLGWAVLAGFVVLGVVGPLLTPNQTVLDLSPFAHTPRLPGGTVDAVPLVTLVAIAAALIALGLVTFRRRDVPTT